MGALACDLPEPLPALVTEEIQRLGPVDLRVAALVLVPVSEAESGAYRIAFATRHFIEMTGYEGDELAGSIADWLEGPDTDPVTLADLRAALANGELAELELLSYTKAGAAFWAHVHLHPLKRRDGSLEGFSMYLTPKEKSRAGYLSGVWQEIEDRMSEDRH